MKIVKLGKFLKTENLREIVSDFCVGRALMPVQPRSHANFHNSLLEFRVIFVFKNLTSATVFNLKSPNFRHLLILTCSFHF